MKKTRTTIRKNRHARIRARVYGTAQKPRLFVFKSNKHIYGSVRGGYNYHGKIKAFAEGARVQGLKF
jgi:ribosomal protein L18